MRRFLPFAIIGVVLLIAAGGGLLLFRSKYSNTPIKVAPGKPGAEPSHIRGGANARVTLEEFGDYQCTPCGVLAATLLKVEHAYGTRVRVVFRQFPLGMHAHAMTAARAAEAAGLQGRFWEMHDLLFQNAMNWSEDSPRPSRRVMPNGAPDASPDETPTGVRAVFAHYAATLGLDVERFKKDMDSDQVIARIKSDRERGASIGVDRTPILFIDGVQIPFSSFNVEALHVVIDAALSGQTPVPLSQSPTPAQPK
jgi:2-hydroxychromene-2-carboxylate isomerase